jgi:hypothetical protein
VKVIKPGDIAIIGISIIIIGLFTFFAYRDRGNNLRIHIHTAEEEWVFPINQEETLTIEGPLGETVIRIEEESVRVLSSPCKQKTCIAAGRISRAGSWIACLPNRVFIRIEGTDKEEVDAGTY